MQNQVRSNSIGLQSHKKASLELIEPKEILLVQRTSPGKSQVTASMLNENLQVEESKSDSTEDYNAQELRILLAGDA